MRGCDLAWSGALSFATLISRMQMRSASRMGFGVEKKIDMHQSNKSQDRNKYQMVSKTWA